MNTKSELLGELGVSVAILRAMVAYQAVEEPKRRNLEQGI
jgi:hypothetical protein